MPNSKRKMVKTVKIGKMAKNVKMLKMLKIAKTVKMLKMLKMAKNVKMLKMAKKARMPEMRPLHGGQRRVQRKIGVLLPVNLIYEVMVRLPARSLGRFRCLSKSLLSIISNPSFISAHVQHNRFAHQSFLIRREDHCHTNVDTHKALPCLSSVCIDGGGRITLCELTQIKEIYKSRLVSSCDGLLLYHHMQIIDLHFIINPLTGQSITLPWTTQLMNGIFGFYFHPSTSKYRLLVDAGSRRTDVLVVGTINWRRIHCRRPASFQDYHPVDVNGSLYWLAWKKFKERAYLKMKSPTNIMAFDKEAEVYSLLPMPPSNEHHGGSLIDFNGELGLWVISDYGIVELWIMKECWIKRHLVSLPDLAGCPMKKKYFRYREWKIGYAISIKHEHLLIGFSYFRIQGYLVQWDLKSGACLVQDVQSFSSRPTIECPYMETLVSIDHSVCPCIHSFIQHKSRK